MLWGPTARGEASMLKLAFPEASRGAVPRVVPPSTKGTKPVGGPLIGEFAVTVAVKVTGWPNTEGLTEELTPVVVPAGLTTWVKSLVLVLVLKFGSPS